MDSLPVEHAITALEKPGSVLLFVVVIIGMVVMGSYFESTHRIEKLTSWMSEVETHRNAEILEVNEVLKGLMADCLQNRSQ